MKLIEHSLVSASLLLILISGSSLAGDSGESIRWHQFDEGMALAKSENKLAVLEFGAVWCTGCEDLNKTTFSDKDVISLQDRCVFIKVDVDSDDEAVNTYFSKEIKLLGSSLGRSSEPIHLPKIIITDSQGKELSRTDSIPATELIKSIKDAMP